MVEMRQMGELVHHHVTADRFGHHDQAPVQHDPSGSCATPPAGAGIAASETRDLARHSLCLMSEFGGEHQPGPMPEKNQNPMLIALNGTVYL